MKWTIMYENDGILYEFTEYSFEEIEPIYSKVTNIKHMLIVETL
jgi:hypothetical protein